MLPDEVLIAYSAISDKIKKRLEDFANVNESEYFYEMCFCLLTPQSKAKNAMMVVDELKRLNFFENPFDASDILRRPANYIRFHNSKAQRLLEARESFPIVKAILNSELSTSEKRLKIKNIVNGYGMKEASHFLRNIGFRGLTILDRHILKLLVVCCVYTKVPDVSTVNNYLSVENKFLEFARNTGFDVDELDLLFWSMNTGEILK
jgi:N-glycosylase/DNA lyase